MVNPVIFILKKTYKILIVLVVAIGFFLGYNVYVVDRSLLSLRGTLDKIDNIKTLKDGQKIASLLDHSFITEITNKKSRADAIVQIEMAKDILNTTQNAEQLQDAKVALQQVIKQKEEGRSGALKALDQVTRAIVPAAPEKPESALEKRVRYLKDKIRSIKDKDLLQEAYYELGNAYVMMSDFREGRKAYFAAAGASPGGELAAKSKFNAAWSYQKEGDTDSAIAEFDRLSRGAPGDDLTVLSKYQLAEIYRSKADYRRAVEIFNEILTNKQSNPELASLAGFKAGYALLYDLKEPEKAREVFNKVKRLFPGSQVSGRIDEKMMPDIASGYRAKGFTLLEQGRKDYYPHKFYKEAVVYFNRALEVYPEDGGSYIGKAMAYLWLDDASTALEFARQAVKFMPKSEMASINLGYIYIQLSFYDDAIAEYKRFISIGARSAHSYYNLGCAYVANSQIKEAAAAFSEAVKIEPKFASALNNLGWCLWKLGKYSEATEAFSRALDIEPGFLDALYNLGAVYKVMGKYEESRTNFLNVLKIDPRHAEAQEQLRRVESVMQQKEAIERRNNPILNREENPLDQYEY